MANQDEPITNNPLLPFLQIPSKTNLSHPASLTPVETLAAGQQIKEAKLAEEEEDCIRMTLTSVQSNGDVIEVVLTYLSFKYFNHYFMNSIFHSFNYHFNILL